MFLDRFEFLEGVYFMPSFHEVSIYCKLIVDTVCQLAIQLTMLVY